MRILDIDRAGLFTRRARAFDRRGKGLRTRAVPPLHGGSAAAPDRRARVPTAPARGATRRLRSAARDRVRGRASHSTMTGDDPCRRSTCAPAPGAVALAIADERPAATVFATDLSAEAVSLARANAAPARPRGHRAARRPVRARARAAAWSARSCDREPAVPARGRRLDAAGRRARGSGVRAVRRCRVLRTAFAEAAVWLRPGGVIVVEIDAREGMAIAAAARAAGFVEVRVVEDLTGRDRVVAGRRP